MLFALYKDDMNQLRVNGTKKNTQSKYYIDDEDYIKRSNEDRSRRDRDKKKKSHNQYSPEYLEETLYLQQHTPFDYRRKKYP